MLRKTLFFIIVFIASLNLHSQIYSRQQLNELEESLELKKGVPRIHALIELSEAYYQFQLDTSLLYAEEARLMASNVNYQWGIYKSLYCWANVKFLNEHQRIVEPVAHRTAVWFSENGFMEDAAYSEILEAKCIKGSRGLKAALKKAEETLEKAQQIKDPRLIGVSWLAIDDYNGDSYENPLDSASFYLKQTKDSLWILWVDQMSLKANRNSIDVEHTSINALESALKWENKMAEGQSLYFLCYWKSSLGDYDSVFYYREKYTFLMDSFPNYRQLMRLEEWVSVSPYNTLSMDLRIEYYEKAIEVAQELGAKWEELRYFTWVNQSLYAIGEHKKAVSQTLEAIQLAHELNDKYQENYLKVNLGNLYINSKEYDKAEKVLKEIELWSRTLSDSVERQRFGAGVNMTLSLLYCETQDFDNAIHHAEKSIANSSKWRNFSINGNLIILKVHLEQENTELAKIQYKYVLESYDKNYLENLTFFQIVKGRHMVAIGNYQEGIKTITNYLPNSPNVRIHENTMVAYRELYKAYKGIGDYKSALAAHEEFKEISDSMQINVVEESMIEIESKAEIAQKEAEIKGLQKQQEINDLILVQQESDLELRKLYLIVLGFGLLFMLTIGYLLFRRYQYRKEQQQVELELANLQANQKVELAEVKNTLFANISHEFRTPLTLIKVPIENHMSKLEAADQSMFKGVLNNTDQLLKMVDELLDLARMTSGEVELNKSVFELSHFLSPIKTNFQPLFAEKEIQFVWKNELTGCSYDGDENRLKMVLNNLLKNAYAHTPEAGQVTCTIRQFGEDDLKISVTNTGSNISQEDYPYIFERYYRGNETGYVGNGIGLSLSKQIVEMHGGQIAVDNNVANSVSFHVFLPDLVISSEKVAPVWTAEQEAKEAFTTHEAKLSRGNKVLPSLLVVEDNDEMRTVLENVLKDDFNLFFAENGEVGEQMAIEHQPDLILSDVMMPKKDGFELLQALKNTFETSHIPVILLTAKADSESRIIGLDQDADDYLVKPFDTKELKARAQNLIRQRKQLQKLFSEHPIKSIVKEKKLVPLDAQFFEKVQTIVEQNYADGNFTATELCSELALNRNSVYKKIKAYTNQGTAQYLRNFRLRRAAELLLEENMSITHIFNNCGFNSSQAFNKAFKEEFKLSPREYRNVNLDSTN